MDQIASFFSSTWAIILAVMGFGFIIFIHELGHFIMAKRAGVRVDKFYIGFDFGGWKIFSFKRNGTEYGIGLIPFGGYVKLHGIEELPGHETELKDFSNEHYQSKTIGERFGIMVGGVAMNFIGAMLLILVMYGIGKEFDSPIVGDVVGVPALEGGLKTNDKILSIDDKPVKTFIDVQKEIVLTPEGGKRIFQVERDGKIVNLTITPQPNQEHGTPEVGFNPKIGNQIGYLYPGLPASKAGFEVNDKILRVNDKEISAYYEFEEIVENSCGKELLVEVERKGQTEKIKLTPEAQPSYYRRYETGFKNQKGVEVQFVNQGSAADKMGFQAGDYIAKVNGISVYHLGEISKILFETKGAEVPVELLREGKTIPLKITPKYSNHLRKYLFGINITTGGEIGPIREIEVGGPAYDAGLRKGDQILEINHKVIDSVSQLTAAIRKKEADEISIKYFRKSTQETLEAKVTPRSTSRPNFFKRTMYKINTALSGEAYIFDQHGLGIRTDLIHVLGPVDPDSPAAKAGFMQGDVLNEISYTLSPNNSGIRSFKSHELPWGWSQIENCFSEMARAASRQEKSLENVTLDTSNWQVRVSFKRGDKQMEALVSCVDSEENSKGFTGLEFNREKVLYRYQSFGEAFRLVFQESYGMLEFTVVSFGKLVSGQISTDALSGPVGIFPVIHEVSKSGIIQLIWVIAMLNINIGFMNLLPFPPLDGGAIFFLIIEKIKGSPVSPKFQMRVANFGVLCLLTLMVFVTLNDISRLL